MTDTKHTPGPWVRNETWGLIVSGDVEVAALHSGNEANARLIAAAPELLAALKWIAAHGDTGEGRRPAYYDMRAKARAAIAKAAGG
jgi:hypothetical protein